MIEESLNIRRLRLLDYLNGHDLYDRYLGREEWISSMDDPEIFQQLVQLSEQQ